MTSTHTVEEINSTRRKFRIAVQPSSIKEAINSAVTEIQKTADVRGFRKGKVPPAMVRKFFENDVRKKALDAIIEKSYQSAIQSSDMQVVSYPQIEPEGQFSETADFVFTATVDVNPPLDIKGYKELTLKLVGKDIDDTDINQELERLGQAIGKFSDDSTGSAAQENDFVNVSYTGKIEGVAFNGGSAANQRLQLGKKQLLPEFESGIVGAKPGEARTFNVTFPEDYHEQTLQGKTAQFELTLNKVEKLELPEFNDEFAKKFGAETIEALKRSIRDFLTDASERSKLEAYQEQIIEKLLATNNFEVPESLVDSTVDRAIQDANTRLEKNAQLDPKNDAHRTEFQDMALAQVRGVLALGNVARLEGITVADNELGPEIMQVARANNMTPDDLIRRAGRQMIEEIRGRVLLSKVIKHLVGINKVEAAATN